MKLLITGAAGNLGTLLSRSLLDSGHELKLLIHKRYPAADITANPNVSVHVADLARGETLIDACRGTDCIIHFAGVLFRARPEKFLPQTNTIYVQNLVNRALDAGVGRFILVSFPHVEGVTTPQSPALGTLEGSPHSVHARTRLAAEKYMYRACADTGMTPVSLRPGMIYGRGVLMIDAARWLARHRMLGVWRQPTWIHLLSLADFLSASRAAIEKEGVQGIYNLGDEKPLLLQDFLDIAARHWRSPEPWRAPAPLFYAAAALTELYATAMRTRAPLTRDFIRIGMASYVSDTTRMKEDLLPELEYPTLAQGIDLL